MKKKNFSIFIIEMLLFTSIVVIGVNGENAKIGKNVISDRYNNILPGWAKTYGGDGYDQGCFAQQTSDSGYICVGETKRNFLMIKTDENGDKLWQKMFGGGSGSSVCLCAQQTSDGGYILSGSSQLIAGNGYDVRIIKTDSKGNTQWDKTFGGSGMDLGKSVKETSDGGYVALALTELYHYTHDFWLIKLDAVGNLVWEKAFDAGSYEFPGGFQMTKDGGFIIAGDTFAWNPDSPGASVSAWVIKTDSQGNKIWSKMYGGDGDSSFNGIELTQDNGYLILGDTTGKGVKIRDIWLIKIDENGNKLWDKTFGGEQYERGDYIQRTNDGGYVIVSTTRSFGGTDTDFWLIKIDENGNEIWNQVYGGIEEDNVASVQQTNDGGYILAGETKSYGAGYYDAWFIKTDENGIIIKDNNPPVKPAIPNGSKIGGVRNEIFYRSSTFDQDGDKIYYLFNWDDHSVSDWIGPFESNSVAETSHIWDKWGVYQVQVKARDEYGYESEWSEPLKVAMPRSKLKSLLIFNNILVRLFDLVKTQGFDL